MNNEYVQNLRYKLQKRVRKLNSTGFRTFHITLKHLWEFMNSNEVIRGIMDDLALRYPAITTAARSVLTEHKPQIGDTEYEHAALCHHVLAGCAASTEQMVEVRIAHGFRLSDTKHDAALEMFRDTYLEPLYEYIDEQLDDQRAVLALLRRYKHKCEWFARESLYKRWQDDTQWGERGLAEHLYEYLHDQGIDFHIEPQSASGEADLIAMQKTDDPLIADAKIFDPDRSKGKTYIAKGFAQVYRYSVDFNEPFGYLIVYLTGKHDLRFTLQDKAQSTPFVVYNNKTIFLMTIDLFPHEESASKRGTLKPVEITEDDLIQSVEEEITGFLGVGGVDAGKGLVAVADGVTVVHGDQPPPCPSAV